MELIIPNYCIYGVLIANNKQVIWFNWMDELGICCLRLYSIMDGKKDKTTGSTFVLPVCQSVQNVCQWPSVPHDLLYNLFT